MNLSKRARRIAPGVLVFLVFALRACGETSPQAAIDLGYDGQHLVLANCEESMGRLTYLLVSERERQGFGGEEWMDLLDARDGPMFDTGDQVSTDPAVWRSVDVSNSAGLLPGNQIGLLLKSDADVRSAEYVVPEGGLAAGEWLSSAGELAKEPCAQ